MGDLFVLPLFLVAALVVVVIAVCLRWLPSKIRMPTFVLMAMFVFTPSLAPMTVTAVPIPFGLLFFYALIGGGLHELPGLLGLFWKWNVVAFFVTGAIGYLIGRFLLSNIALKFVRFVHWDAPTAARPLP